MIQLKKYRAIIILIGTSAYAVFRSLLGPANVCIYLIPCPHYAKTMLQQQPFYISIPLITLRLLSCNPLTALIRNAYSKIRTNQREKHFAKSVRGDFFAKQKVSNHEHKNV